MNSFLILVIVSVMLCLGISALVFRGRNIVFVAVMGAVAFFCSYILGTMGLFVLNRYTLFRGIAATAALDMAVFAAAFLTVRPKPFSLKELFKFDFDMRPVLIPVIVSILAVPLTANKNELFGMGQDEGVYQTVAINFMNGLDERQQDFEEYHQLESEEARENFQWFVNCKLVGYDIPEADYPETVYDTSISEVSGIYHSIPTYAAVLAMWGELFGMENMMEVQTVFYVLAIFLVSFVGRNLKLKRISEAAAVIMTAFSPIVIWVAKAALTEMFLAVLMAAFLFFITDAEHPKAQVLSIIPVAVFACYHVSIYTMIPYVLIVYGGMYFFTGRKQFAVLMPVTAAGYFLSYFMMKHVQPFYTMNNYRSLFVGGITVHNITAVVIAGCAVLLVVVAVYIALTAKLRKEFSLQKFSENPKNVRAMKILFIVMLTVPVLFIIIQSLRKFDSFDEAGYLTLVGFAANAGIVLIPAAFIAAFIRPKVFMESTSNLVIFISFFYCVLMYSAFLRFEIDYYYYYARYLVPFIPAAVLFAALALDKAGAKLIAPAAALSLCYSAPYDAYLMRNKDDTRLEWSVLNDVCSYVSENDCVVIDSESAMSLWLPVRAVTGAKIFPLESDMEAQMNTLKERYDSVYFISSIPYTYNFDANLETVYIDTIQRSEDYYAGDYFMDGYEHEIGSWIPMSRDFLKAETPVYMYRYIDYDYEYDIDELALWAVSGFGAKESKLIWTDEEFSSIRCMLEKDDYELTVELGCDLPLEAIGSDDIGVKLYVNGNLTDTCKITDENNGQSLVFDIPAEYLNEGSNMIGFESRLWKASVVSEADKRELGIPVASLSFASAES